MKSIFDEVGSYLKAHRDLIMTLGLVFLADHFLLKGALKMRLQSAVGSLLAKAEKKLEAE